MPKRNSSRGVSVKGFTHYAPFWVAPLSVIVLAPLFLHVASEDLAESTDEHLFAAAVLFLTIVSFSIVGCILDEVCICQSSFPVALLVTQMMLVVGAFTWRSSLFRIEHQIKTHTINAKSLTKFLSHGPLLHAKKPELAKALDLSVSQRLEAVVVPTPKPDPMKAWTDVGDGYCEDAESHQEFSSMASAGKSLQECAQDGMNDPQCVAFDFAESGGQCDLRFAEGTVGNTIEGYNWWGWGAAEGRPAGSGKQKHGVPTRCYMRVSAQASMEKPPGQLSAKLHPAINQLIKEYPFQPVRTDRGQLVNIILVRSPFRSKHQEQLFHKYKDEILFIGISSFEDYPLPPPNPFSGKFPVDKYVGLFPGFLHMMREPEKIFPSNVKLLLMSQSDFSLPYPQPPVPKIYDFTFSGSDQDVANDCVGWSSYAKNWSFVKQALEVMCAEGVSGVLVATKDKQDRKACTIPDNCAGLIKQTKYLSQDEFFSYVKQSHFLFVPQVHDASPRVTTQALALNVPLLMNRNLIGGWKYVNEKTGEFFNDINDFPASLRKILRDAKSGGVYEPRKYVDDNLGDAISGVRLRKWVEENFADRVMLPVQTNRLYPAGA